MVINETVSLQGSIGEWLRCYREIPYKFDIRSSVPYHKNNSIQGYRSLIFRSTTTLLYSSVKVYKVLINSFFFLWHDLSGETVVITTCTYLFLQLKTG